MPGCWVKESNLVVQKPSWKLLKKATAEPNVGILVYPQAG